MIILIIIIINTTTTSTTTITTTTTTNNKAIVFHTEPGGELNRRQMIDIFSYFSMKPENARDFL